MKKTLLLWAALALLLLAFCVPSLADGLEAVTYLDWDSDSASLVERVQDEYTVLTGGSVEWDNGWYVADGSLMISERVQANGDVHLILLDGAELIVEGGIGVSDGGSLTIYACSMGDSMGRLRVYDVPEYCAGIGSSHGDNSTITIYGGSITAIGGDWGAGIGSGNNGSSTVNIYGGSIDADGGINGAGIGNGSSGYSTVNIFGGSIEATGGEDGAGIGSSKTGNSTVNIYGGSIDADGGVFGAGIGSGNDGYSTVNISGGSITAAGGNGGAGIGNGWYGGSTVNISGGNITAYGSGYGAGIGNSQNSSCSVTVRLSSENDSLLAGSYYCSNRSDRCTVTLQDCVLTDGEGQFYRDTLNISQLDAMANKTLVQARYNVTIAEGIPRAR